MEQPVKSKTSAAPTTVFASILYWSPLALALALLAQVALRGLRPALEERARLDAQAEIVRARHAHAEAAFQATTAEVKAWDDPVYHERMRRRRAAAAAAGR